MSTAMSRLVQAVQILIFLSVVAILVSLAASEIFLALAFLCWLPIGFQETIQKKRLAVEWPPFFLPVQIFVLATILSVIFSKDPAAGWPSIKKLLLFFLCFLVVRFFDSEWTQRTLIALFGLGSVVGVVSAWQFVEKWLRFHRTKNPADNPTLIFRVEGFMGHWMTFSGEQLLVLAALVAFLVLFPLRRRWAWILATVLVFGSVILGFTRSAWLAALAVLIVAVLKYRSKMFWVFPIVAILLAVFFHRSVHERLDSFFDRSFSSNVARVEMAEAGWRMFRAHPWFGVGPQRIRPEFEAILAAQGETHPQFYTGHLHDNFIQLAAERGVFALVAFVWLILELGWRFWRGSNDQRLSAEVRVLFLSGLFATIALVVAGMFEYNFSDSEVFILFLFLISAPYGRFGSRLGEPRSAAETPRAGEKM